MTKPKDNLSIDYVRSRLNYDPETGKLIWKPVGPDFGWQHLMWNGKWAGKEAGNFSDQGYRNIYMDGRNWKGHRLAWAIHYGEWPEGDIDHVNGDRSDNRISNLRKASRSQNLCNMKTRRKGLKGAIRHKENYWEARIAVNGEKHSLGYFRTEADAHEAYCHASEFFHGSFSRTS